MSKLLTTADLNQCLFETKTQIRLTHSEKRRNDLTKYLKKLDRSRKKAERLRDQRCNLVNYIFTTNECEIKKNLSFLLCHESQVAVGWVVGIIDNYFAEQIDYEIRKVIKS